jgi:N-methylhydantoinase B
MSKSQTDPVVVQVVRNGLDSVAEQMAVTLRRTAYSTIIREVLDYATALFDRQGRLVAQSSRIPLFVNAMGPTLRFVLENNVPLSEWEEGDVYLVNDPYLGGSQHLPDLATFMPIFHEGKLVGIAGAIGHHVDVGGSSPGGYNLKSTDIFQEGLRIPPVRLIKRGEVVEDIKRLVTANFRLPDLTWGDIGAQIASMQIGQRGFAELLSRFGVTTVEACVEELLDYSERMIRAGLRTIPRGSYGYVDFLDDDGTSEEPIRIQVKLEVGDGEIVADFTGTSAQRPSPINGSESMVLACVQYAIMAAVSPDAPVNEGCFRPVKIIAPIGTVVNAQPPAPVVGRIAVCHRCCDVVLGALVDALPGRIPAAYYGMSNIISLSGKTPGSSTPWIFFEVLVGGWGGRPGSDGVEACSAHIHNVANTPVEMLERLYPLRIETYSLRPDSGGAGEYRGGCGLVREIRLIEGEALLSLHSDRTKTGAYGLFGGGKGATAEWILNRGREDERRLSSKEAGIKLRAGDLLTVRTQGGGGYGSPAKRTSDATQRDLRAGKVSEAAVREPGIGTSTVPVPGSSRHA